MSRRFLPCVLILPLFTAGCLLDYAARRSVTIDQLASINVPSKQFTIDTSEIPADWIEERKVVEQPGGEEVRLRLRSDHAVVIRLVPESAQPTR